MKAKVVRGKGFRGALDYVFDVGAKASGKKRPEIVAGTVAGRTPAAMAREFGATRRLKKNIKKPVWHCSLSLPEGERLSKEQWAAVAADYMRIMGFSDSHLWTAVRHNDTDYDHIHIIASRIGLDSSVWLGQLDVKTAIKATQALERKHGLTLTAAVGEPTAKTLSHNELNRAARTGEKPAKLQLQELLDAAATDRPTVTEFIERLQVAGVGVTANIANTGKVNGLSFALGDMAYKGSQLGKKYGWNQLIKRVDYEQTRDGAALANCRATAANHQTNDAATAEHRSDKQRGNQQSSNDQSRDDRPNSSVRYKRTGERGQSNKKTTTNSIRLGTSASNSHDFTGCDSRLRAAVSDKDYDIITTQQRLFYQAYKVRINDPLRDYYIDISNEAIRFANRSQRINITDKGDCVEVDAGDDITAAVATTLKICQAKGWALDQIEFEGSERFCAECRRQVKEIKEMERLETEARERIEAAKAVIAKADAAIETARNENKENRRIQQSAIRMRAAAVDAQKKQEAILAALKREVQELVKSKDSEAAKVNSSALRRNELSLEIAQLEALLPIKSAAVKQLEAKQKELDESIKQLRDEQAEYDKKSEDLAAKEEQLEQQEERLNEREKDLDQRDKWQQEWSKEATKRYDLINKYQEKFRSDCTKNWLDESARRLRNDYYRNRGDELPHPKPNNGPSGPSM